MEDSDFSDEFCRFIQTTVPSVTSAEVLLHLFARPAQWWDPREIPSGLPAGVVASEPGLGTGLELLRERGLIEVGAEGRIRYRPESDALDTMVRTLARAYNERPVTLIHMIYALRDSKIRSFADAFKFRKG
jgi:hypothetical protein